MLPSQRIKLPIILLTFGAMLFSSCARDATHTDPTINNQADTVFLAGNAFVTQTGTETSAQIESEGLTKWSDPATIVSTYIRVAKPGDLQISLPHGVLSATQSSVINIRVNDGEQQTVEMEGDQDTPYNLGSYQVDTGYVKIDLQGVSRSDETFAEVPALLVSGEATEEGTLFSNDPDYFYWARRGPSCHLAYTLPTEHPVSYFYSEINVPENQDPIGSYFMANGFGEGYFGIQVNTENERRILFSVWSPHETDDPNTIPDDKKITLNKKGKNVHVGEFGNEGSGGQSYLIYPWESDKTYRFLLKGKPDGDGKTDYTAWFYSPDEEQWLLIASFKRPETDTHLTRFHSFLENFNPDQGFLGRSANYFNQWVRTADGQWLKIEEAKFTVDATYSAKQRTDAIGGVDDAGYFLRNGGFFSEQVEPKSTFNNSNEQSAPAIDFEDLP